MIFLKRVVHYHIVGRFVLHQLPTFFVITLLLDDEFSNPLLNLDNLDKNSIHYIVVNLDRGS
jgi:hypothetical protein